MSRRSSLVAVSWFVALAALKVAARRAQLRWGATDEEVAAFMPGDERVSVADLIATRAIGIDAPVEAVWPWVVQIGQGRGGFYSYDWLENLAGCQIHSSDVIEDRWQTVEAGQPIRLHPDVALAVAALDPPRSLVLGPTAESDDPRDTASSDDLDQLYDFSWAFVVQPDGSSRSRLVVRERYAGRSLLGRALVEPLAVVSFVMTQRMLRGIRDRAESTGM